MGSFLGSFVLPLLLIAASMQDWNLISLINLLLLFAVLYTSDRRGFNFNARHLVLWSTIIFSIIVVLMQIIFEIILFTIGGEERVIHNWWLKFIGFGRMQPWRFAAICLFLVVQMLTSVVAFVETCSSLTPIRSSSWWNLCPAIDRLGSHLKVVSCLLLPAIQLVVGISYPSWTCLPFFICSCVGLVNWSLTSNFLGLFQWWRALMMYACFVILTFYLYQLPLELPASAKTVAEFIGLYKISSSTEWPEMVSSSCLLLFFFMLSSVKCDLEDMDFILSMQGNNLTERLILSNHSFFIRESRSGVRHTNVLLRGLVFQNFSINYFTYGFPVLLLALAFWSYSFASICAFGLLAYVGYILFVFPSLFHLHKLNGLLLAFILLWAASTYVFNVAFTFLNKEIKKDMEMWETIGLWHYPIPGFFLFAQFCLGFLVALGNLVNNSVFQYLSDGEDDQSSNNDDLPEDEDKKVLFVATVAWALHKISRAITLVLIFLLVTKPGIIHAIYMVFFLVYLLSHSVSRKIRQALIFLCEAHFVVLYILQLDLIAKAVHHSGQGTREILLQLGLLNRANFLDFMEIGGLLCFCAVQNHGFKMLFSFSAIVQHCPSPPFGFSILKAGVSKSVLRSVYSSTHDPFERHPESSNEHSIISYLAHVEKRCLSIYRSCGTYVAFLTILLTVYLVTPNFISFGYLCFLLFWIIGRQLVEKTKKRLWLPLKVYAFMVFIFTYSLGEFSTFRQWLSCKVNLYPDFGFDPEATLLKNIWESLAILTVMQLYSYERRKSRLVTKPDAFTSEIGLFGFLRRFLIWHSEKLLSVAVFYSSLSPVSAFGFVYLIGLVLCSMLPKASRLPSKFFLGYTGLLVMLEYLFQLWSKTAHMLPGQSLYRLSLFLGLKSFNSGFWGLEAGLRGKILVIIACTLQYNTFHWLETLPISLTNNGSWEDPCHLFVSRECVETSGSEVIKVSETSYVTFRRKCESSNPWPSFSSCSSQTVDPESMVSDISGNDNKRFSFAYIWGSSKESHKWNKKRIATLRKERFEMQKTTLKVYLKFWIENLSNLVSLEINMIALLLASFAILNAVSLFYILCLLTCILLKRDVLRKLWPAYFFCFAVVLILEYFAMWKDLIQWPQESTVSELHCHDCWKIADMYYDYCQKCWLGIKVDEQRMLVSYYLVFILSSFKLRSGHLSKFSKSFTYDQMKSQQRNASVWRDLSFDTKGMWTTLDYIRLYSYCHLVDIVLALILITGTLEYDILHLGYLGFALVFFRMRPEILKKKNKIFKYLRIYNFTLIVLSLAYQSPYLGDYSTGTCEKIEYLYEVIGFYKYDYGFRITSRSALVEIVIFFLVSIQSFIFSSKEFDYVFRYLEAEQIGAIVREQEKKAAWKTAQLQYIRMSEDQKRKRNLQVEKMKAEMLNIQCQLDNINAASRVGNVVSENGLRRRRNSSLDPNKMNVVQGSGSFCGVNDQDVSHQLLRSDCILTSVQESDSSSEASLEVQGSPVSTKSENSLAVETLKKSMFSVSDITEAEEKDNLNPTIKKPAYDKVKCKENPLLSAVQFIGDGVSQVQSLGNQAVTNIVSFLNIEPDDSDSNGYLSAEDGLYEEIESQTNALYGHFEGTSSVHSGTGMEPIPASLQIGRIFRFIWAQMRSNNDVVCYCCFVLVFLWDFSLLSMVYLAALFLYALCVNSGPSYIFWVITLIFTEMNILLRYLYQIIIQHCGLSTHLDILTKFGFPSHKIMESFVISTFPLFLVYIFTLLQRSITAKDGEWASLSDRFYNKSFLSQDDISMNVSWTEWVVHLFYPFINLLKLIQRCFFRYWTSLTEGSEAPPYFVQLLMRVDDWPLDGIQPERVETALNHLLVAAHEERCVQINRTYHATSRVRVQSIERNQDNIGVAVTVFEVIYSSPLIGCPVTKWYRSLTPAADVANEIEKARESGLAEEIGFPYPILSVIGGGKIEVDLYAYTFCADLAVFFLVAMFYQSVSKTNSQLLDVYQLEDQFPKEFVFVLMVLFFLIVMDRVIYLCSFATGKLVFYIFNLVLFTYSVTKYAWCLQPSHQHVGALAIRAIYLTKAISLALQALQIKNGLPHKSTLYRQFLTSKVSQVNYLGFRLYRALPFLYELRCVLDWSCTSTSLTMYDWLKLEDINASLFLVKCDANLNRAQHRQGEKQTKMTKFCSGICLFFILICVIWAPMLIYSSGNPTNITNPILDVTVQIDLKTNGGRLTIFQTTMCEKLPWDTIDTHIDLDPLRYLDTYNEKDIQLICCQADAITSWLVPDIVLAQFIQSLDQNMEIIFYWIFTRDRPKGKEVVKYESVLQSLDHKKVEEVKQVLNRTTHRFIMDGIYHRYFRVTGSGDVRYFGEMEHSVDVDATLNMGFPPWWSSHDLKPLHVERCTNLTGPMAVVVSEETPQGIIGETLSKFNIWSLYLTFVLAVGRFIRLQCSDLRMRIPYENLPFCDRLIAICEDIYAARAEGELEVEEVLYWTLVKIYRSPHMLLEYTKFD